MEWRRNGYRISTDSALLDLDTIHQFLSRSYWAAGRTKETVKRSIDRSLCFGVYAEDHQVGFARVVTDYTTFYWLCDVFIDERDRGRGLGKWLMQCIVEAKELEGLYGILATRDAHGLYARYGFCVPENPRKFMVRKGAQVSRV